MNFCLLISWHGNFFTSSSKRIRKKFSFFNWKKDWVYNLFLTVPKKRWLCSQSGSFLILTIPSSESYVHITIDYPFSIHSTTKQFHPFALTITQISISVLFNLKVGSNHFDLRWLISCKQLFRVTRTKNQTFVQFNIINSYCPSTSFAKLLLFAA